MYCSFIYHFIFSKKAFSIGIVLLMQVVCLSELNNLHWEIKHFFGGYFETDDLYIWVDTVRLNPEIILW